MHSNDLAARIRATTDAFVRDITALACQSAVQLVESALGGKAAVHDLVKLPKASRGKRTPGDLDALSDKFASFVAANPGLRIEQINKQLGTKTKSLALPIRKLIAGGRVRTKGQKRSTTYFAGKAK